jgi:hypothetical protein
VPTAFVWCERDRLISLRFSEAAARACPHATPVLLPCAGHWLNGPHHRCLAAAVTDIAPRLLAGESERSRTRHAVGVDFEVYACLVTPATTQAPPALAMEDTPRV